MAELSAWLWTALGLLPALMVGLWRCGRGPLSQRLVALQLTTSVSVCELVTLSFAFGQPSSADLALTLGLLSLPAGLLLASFSERWL